jgi:hypothetical protein
MQMIGRYRRAQDFTVYIPKRMNGKAPTNASEIYASMKRALNLTQAAIWFSGDRVHMGDEQDRYLALSASVEAKRNVGLNNLYPHFIKLARENYRLCLDDAISGSDWTTRLNEINRVQSEGDRQLILESEPVPEDQYERRRVRGDISDEHLAGYIRWQIETFYKQTITEDLVEEWDGGRGRHRLLRFMLLHMPIETAVELDREEEEQGIADEDRGHYYASVGALKVLLGAAFPSGFFSGVTAERDFCNQVDQMYEVAQQPLYQDVLVNRLGERPDHKQEPIALLRRLLSQIGLKLRIRTRQSRGNQIKEYAINPVRRSKMIDLAYRRARAVGIDFQLGSQWWQ